MFCEIANDGRYSGAGTKINPLSKFHPISNSTDLVPELVARVVSLARAVIVAAASVLSIGRAVGAVPADPLVTVAVHLWMLTRTLADDVALSDANSN